MVLPYSTVSGNEMTVWLLIFLSTDHCISWQGRIADLVLVPVCEILEWERRPAYRKHGVFPLLQASARARMRGHEATADYIVVGCWCCCGLWLQVRTHNPPLGRRGVYVKRQQVLIQAKRTFPCTYAHCTRLGRWKRRQTPQCQPPGIPSAVWGPSLFFFRLQLVATSELSPEGVFCHTGYLLLLAGFLLERSRPWTWQHGQLVKPRTSTNGKPFQKALWKLLKEYSEYQVVYNSWCFFPSPLFLYE